MIKVNPVFTDTEFKDIILASILTLGVFFSILFFDRFIDTFFKIFIALGGVLIFLTHELSHKFLARRYGYNSEFRISKEGALFTAISMIPFIPIKFIAPGSVFLKRSMVENDELGRVALAGPFSNFILTGIFLILSGLIPTVFQNSGTNLTFQLFLAFYYIAFFSSIIGLFNLIPFGPLDGAKVLHWNRNIFIIVFGFAVVTWFLLLSSRLSIWNFVY